MTDADRLARFVEPRLPALRRAAYRLCRRIADAEDLVQEVCLRAYEQLAALDGIAAPRAWLLKVQYHLHLDRVRRARPTASLDDDGIAADALAAADDPAADADRTALAERLAAAWPELTPDQQALLAYYAEGYSLRELTEITGLPLSALKARLHRARVRLGKLLQRTAERRPLAAVRIGEKR